MLNRWVEDSLFDTCERNGLGVIAFYPLFQGLLTDKYLNGIRRDRGQAYISLPSERTKCPNKI